MVEFADQTFDFVVTVCDQARQTCPVFPGVHDVHEALYWGYEDPAAAVGSEDERLKVFRRVFTRLDERIHQFVILTERQPV